MCSLRCCQLNAAHHLQGASYTTTVCLLAVVVSIPYLMVELVIYRSHSDVREECFSGRRAFIDQLTTDELNYIKHGEGQAVVRQNDLRYLNFVRTQMSRPPDDVETRKIPRSKTALYKNDYVEIVLKRLLERRNGFYVECGAFNGYTQSNSLYLELQYNWTGLLIEANPNLIRELMSLNRQAYVYGGCLSPTSQPKTMKFTSAGGLGGLHSVMSRAVRDLVQSLRAFESFIDVLCIPLMDLLNAIGVKHVDFLSLDVHGAEIPILKTIDFRQISIDLILVEVYEKDSKKREKLFNEFIEFYNSTGIYREVWRGQYDLMVEKLPL